LAIKGSAQSTEPNLELSTNPQHDLKDSLINKNWLFYKSKALKLKNTNIIIDIETLKNNQKNQTIDSLILLNCSVTVISSEPNGTSDERLKKERTEPPKFWLFKNSASSINIKDCTFKNESNELVGFLYNDSAEDVIFDGNKIENFHGAIYCQTTERENSEIINIDNTTCIIKNNLLQKNSFGNLVITGFKDTLIYKNKVYFAGNGTSGDGFNLDGCSRIVIDENAFLGGSCYGGAVNLKNTEELQIKNNIWINTITSCLRFTEPETHETPVRKVKINISNNYFVDNEAYGIFLENVSKTQIFFEIRQNVFHKTIPAFGLPSCDEIKIRRDNVISIEHKATEEYYQKKISERLPYLLIEY